MDQTFQELFLGMLQYENYLALGHIVQQGICISIHVYKPTTNRLGEIYGSCVHIAQEKTLSLYFLISDVYNVNTRYTFLSFGSGMRKQIGSLSIQLSNVVIEFYIKQFNPFLK